MVPVNLKSLVSKINTTCRSSLEAATGLCLSRTHYNVEVEHWLIKLLENQETELNTLLRYFEVSVETLLADLNQVIARFKTGNARTPALAPNIVELMQDAWSIASLEFNLNIVHSGHILMAVLADSSVARNAKQASKEFDKINPIALQRDYLTIAPKSSEYAKDFAASATTSASDSAGPTKGPSSTPSLDQYTIDLTRQAKAGDIDPVLGRDAEIRQIIDILTRRRQNNPILTGEAGVGKTAVVEGFALRVAKGDVPPVLKNVSIRSLDLSLLQAGAGMKGEFENRLKSVVQEVKSSPQPIILFIDEAHTLVGAGGQAGQGDAANILKPALARGELRTIAATTWAEYKKYFESDAALTRRFQVVKVEEPSEKAAIEMMRGVVAVLERHHNVRILDEAVQAAVKLSHRYIPGRQLPDKCVSLLDTACARVGLSQSATPSEIEDCQRRIEQLHVSISILEREVITGADHQKRLHELEQSLHADEKELAELTERWEAEKVLIEQIRERNHLLEQNHHAKDKQTSASAEPFDAQQCLDELEKLKHELEVLQGEKPLLYVNVDEQAVAAVVAEWTGIPVGRMVSDEINAVLNLQKHLEKRVVGQPHALQAIAERIHTSRANLTDPRKPIGVFLLVGTSGVGKTETALSLAEQLYGGEQNMTVINMSEFKEEHKISMLVGSPPGYVGYGEGGILTEAVRRKPYSVLLLDEMEKAHRSVQEMFYQVFDKGMLMDGEGREIDFKNTLIIMTSNAGTRSIMALYAQSEETPDLTTIEETIRPELLQTFKPAFLGRTTVIPYFPLDDAVLQQITRLQLERIGDRIRQHYQAEFSYSDKLLETVVARCQEVETGARSVDTILSGHLLPALSAEFLAKMAEGIRITHAHIDVDENSLFTFDIR